MSSHTRETPKTFHQTHNVNLISIIVVPSVISLSRARSEPLTNLIMSPFTNLIMTSFTNLTKLNVVEKNISSCSNDIPRSRRLKGPYSYLTRARHQPFTTSEVILHQPHNDILHEPHKT